MTWHELINFALPEWMAKVDNSNPHHSPMENRAMDHLEGNLGAKKSVIVKTGRNYIPLSERHTPTEAHRKLKRSGWNFQKTVRHTGQGWHGIDNHYSHPNFPKVDMIHHINQPKRDLDSYHGLHYVALKGD